VALEKGEVKEGEKSRRALYIAKWGGKKPRQFSQVRSKQGKTGGHCKSRSKESSIECLPFLFPRRTRPCRPGKKNRAEQGKLRTESAAEIGSVQKNQDSSRLTRATGRGDDSKGTLCSFAEVKQPGLLRVGVISGKKRGGKGEGSKGGVRGG